MKYYSKPMRLIDGKKLPTGDKIVYEKKTANTQAQDAKARDKEEKEYYSGSSTAKWLKKRFSNEEIRLLKKEFGITSDSSLKAKVESMDGYYLDVLLNRLKNPDNPDYPDYSEPPKPKPPKAPPTTPTIPSTPKPPIKIPDGKEAPDDGLGVYGRFRKTLKDKGLTIEDYDLLVEYYNGSEKEAKKAVGALGAIVLRAKVDKQKRDNVANNVNDVFNGISDTLNWIYDMSGSQTQAKADAYAKRNDILSTEVPKGELIQNQHSLSKVPFGMLGTAPGNSCGAISAYNACVDMGIDVDFADVYDDFSESGTLLEGALGTNPAKVVEFFNERPEIKNVTVYKDEKDVGEHDSYILVYGGAYSEKSPIIDKNGFEFHYQQFNKDEQGNNVMSNPDESIAGFEDYFDKRLNLINGYRIIGIDKDETYGLPGMMNPNGYNPAAGL